MGGAKKSAEPALSRLRGPAGPRGSGARPGRTPCSPGCAAAGTRRARARPIRSGTRPATSASRSPGRSGPRGTASTTTTVGVQRAPRTGHTGARRAGCGSAAPDPAVARPAPGAPPGPRAQPSGTPSGGGPRTTKWPPAYHSMHWRQSQVPAWVRPRPSAPQWAQGPGSTIVAPPAAGPAVDPRCSDDRGGDRGGDGGALGGHRSLTSHTRAVQSCHANPRASL